MLAQYRTDTRNLLQNPAAPTQLYTQASLDRWINIARGQLAGEAECIRVLATISTVIGQRNYNFSGLDTGVSATNGIAGAMHVRRVSFNQADGQQWISPHAWEWFDLYYLNNVVPENGAPQRWAQYGQGSANAGTGSASTGSFYIDPPPDIVYTLNCDCVCYPIALVDDSTPEAIPYQWVDAVPFFAAYYAYLSSQTSARQADAERMYQHYQTFTDRARRAANPSVNRTLYEQSVDPIQMSKLGLRQSAGQGGG